MSDPKMLTEVDSVYLDTCSNVGGAHTYGLKFVSKITANAQRDASMSLLLISDLLSSSFLSRALDTSVNNSAIYWMVLCGSQAICLWIWVDLRKAKLCLASGFCCGSKAAQGKEPLPALPQSQLILMLGQNNNIKYFNTFRKSLKTNEWVSTLWRKTDNQSMNHLITLNNRNNQKRENQFPAVTNLILMIKK